MPETVGGYHLFQLCLGLGPSEGIRFEELETDLGSGFGTSTGFGINTGIRNWKISFPSISGFASSATVSYNGSLLTPAEYVWALFCNSKAGGDPFVVQSPINDQYYLAKFADKNLDYSRGLTKLFSTGMAFKQWRVEGVSVFDPTKYATPWGSYYSEDLDADWDDGEEIDGEWPDNSGNSHNLAAGVPPTFETNEQNGLPVVRCDDANMTAGVITFTLKELFMVIKIREATWSNYGGVFTAFEDIAVLVGDSGTTKFINLSYPDGFEYRLNGVLYEQTNQQAPMEEFGLVHVRIPGGVVIEKPQIGTDRDFMGRFAAVDYGHIYLFDTLKPLADAREFTEHLITHWDL